MSNAGKSRKPLIIGIVAAVAVLAVLLGLLLTQCTDLGGSGETSAQTVGAIGKAETYDLYWNLDRAEFAGKSEAGMSSRSTESDGFYHIRFFKDGEVVELKVADRKLVNAIDSDDLMGLEIDKDGVVQGVISLDDMPLQQVGWKFYVQSIGGKSLKLNSAKTNEGMAVLLQILDTTGIYDMTGIEGQVGKRITPIVGDRVIAIANLAGDLTHVFVYDRSEYMEYEEGECEHCKQTVQWGKWNKTDELPKMTGHYRLQNDVKVKAQASLPEDQKVCLDLNGKKVEGATNKRVYSIHNPAASLAIMDTSAEQTGVLKAYMKDASVQGGIVWVRYGAFYLYGGTLDGSEMSVIQDGCVMEVRSGAYFYMYGGTIIGGTAKYRQNAETKAYSKGVGGAIALKGKMVMNGGTISGGKAEGAVTKWDKGQPAGYTRGWGGSIYVASNAVFEMNGGIIKNGTATTSGGCIYIAGGKETPAEVTINGGSIIGGRVIGKGRNGGNICVTTYGTLNLNGGSILNGSSKNAAGNMYVAGRVNMTAGTISGGKCYKYDTGALNEADNRANVFLVSGYFKMSGGKVDGSFTAYDADKTDARTGTLDLSGSPVIAGKEDQKCQDLALSGEGVKVKVGNLSDRAKIGVYYTQGIFSEPTKEANVDNFFSNIENADVCYVDGRLAIGRISCICGKQNHYGKCDGTQQLWLPLVSTTMPSETGYYYLTKDIKAKGQLSSAEGADVKLDLNGFTLTGPVNKRAIAVFNEKSVVTLTDTSAAGTGKVVSQGTGTTQGNCVWVRKGSFEMYGGVLDGSGYELNTSWDTGDDGQFGTKDDVTGGRDGGTVCMRVGTTFNMYGGTIIGNTMKATVGEKVLTEGAAPITRNLACPNGASLYVANECTFNMYDGVIRDGVTESNGGNIYTKGVATVNLVSGTITGGKAASGGNLYATYSNKEEPATTSPSVTMGKGVTIEKGKSTGNGGNVRIAAGSFTMNGGVIKDGVSDDHGGNLWFSTNVKLLGGKIENGTAKRGGGNITANAKNGSLEMKNVKVSGGKLTTGTTGANIEVFSGGIKSMTIGEGTVISGGSTTYGGALYVKADAGKAVVTMTGGKIEGGYAKESGGNVWLGENVEMTISGGSVAGGSALAYGGNIHLDADAKLSISGGNISDGFTTGNTADGGTRAGWAGNINITAGAEMNISGTALIENGKAAGNGGNIRLTAGKEADKDGNGALPAAILNISGGTITGGENEDHGGNIWCGGMLNITGGTITNGSSKRGGGNITVNGKESVVNLTGVTISGGKISGGNGANVEIFNAAAKEVKIGKGTVISGGKATLGGNVYISNDVEGATTKVTISAGKLEGGAATDSGGNLYLGAGIDLTMSGGKLTGGTAPGHGGNLYVGAGNTAKISGGTIEKGVAGNASRKGWGGNIKLETGASLELSGKALITGGTAGGNGGNIGTTAADITMTGGTVEKGTSTQDNGGNIFATGALTISGGTITEGTAVSGGNIAINTTKDVVLEGVSITKGVATTGVAGNVRIMSNAPKSITIGEDAQITDGVTVAANKAGANLNLPFATDITFGDCYIDGYVNITDAGANVKLEGKPQIYGAAVGDNNLRVTTNKLDVTDLDVGTDVNKVGITASQGVFTGLAQRGDEGYFFSDDQTKEVGFINGKLSLSEKEGYVALGRYGCRCGSTDGNHISYTVDGKEVACDGTEIFWAAWTSTSTLPGAEHGGAFYLTGPVRVTAQQTIAEGQSVVLDLNGYEVTAGKCRIYAMNQNDTSLTITDTYQVPETTDPAYDANRTGGKMIRSSTYANDGGVIWASNSGSVVTLIKGQLIGSDTAQDNNGGVVRVKGSSVMYMCGGTIKNGTMKKAGGNIYLEGKLYMFAGEILDGNAESVGGNIFASHTSELYIYGGKITGGTDKDGNNDVYARKVMVIDGSAAKVQLGSVVMQNYDANTTTSFRLKGNTDITSLLLSKKDELPLPTITIDGVLSNTDANGTAKKIALTTYENLPHVFTGVVDAANKDVFVPAAADLVLKHNSDSKLELRISRCICGSSDTNHVKYAENGTVIAGCDGTKVEWNLWNSANTLPAEGNYILMNDVVVEAVTEISGNLVLDLNNKTVSVKDGVYCKIFAVAGTAEAPASLTITDNSAEKGGTITGGTGVGSGTVASEGGNIRVGYDATLTLIRGTITNGRARKGGNLCVKGGDLYMLGGAVTNGTALRMTDSGAIHTTKSGWGGNIDFAESVTNTPILVIANCTISGGTTYGNGGNIRANANGSVKILSATISDGTSQNDQGSNLLLAGNSIIQDSTISGGLAKNGGSVTVTAESGKTVTLQNVTIEDGQNGAWGKNDKDEDEIQLSDKAGANLRVTGTCTLNINSGTTISGGESKAPASQNVYIGGNTTVNINGDTTLDADGVNIAGYMSVAENKNPTITVSGKVVIKTLDTEAPSQLTLNGKLLNVGTLVTGSDIRIQSEESTVFAQKATNRTEELTDTDKGFFAASDPTKLKVVLMDGKLQLIAQNSEVACICGTEDNNHVRYTEDGTLKAGCDGTPVEWKAWGDKAEEKTTLPTDGYYYLTDNVTVEAVTEITGNLVLDLNNKTVSVKSGVYCQVLTVANGAKLTITDNSADKGGTITGGTGVGTGTDETAKGGNIYVESGATMTLIRGTISNGRARRGGNICVIGELYMLGGTVSGGTANSVKADGTLYTTGSNAQGFGGNIDLFENSVFVMVDGSVTGGHAKSDGGNIRIYKANPQILGGSVTNGTADRNGGNIFIQDSAAVTIHGGTEGVTINGRVNMAKGKNNSITVSGRVTIHSETAGDKQLELNGETLNVGKLEALSKISIDATEAGAFGVPTAGTTLDFGDKNSFNCTNADLQIVLMGNQLKLEPKTAHIHCICGGDLYTVENRGVCKLADGTVYHTCEDVVYSVLSAAADLGTAGNYYLNAPLSFNNTTVTVSDVNVKLCLNGNNITNTSTSNGKRVFYVKNAGNLAVTSCQANRVENEMLVNNTIKLTWASQNVAGAIVRTENSATFSMYRVTLDGSDCKITAGSQHGVTVSVQNSSTFNQYSGTIIGGENDRGHGGSVGVLAADSAYKMYSGAIKDGDSNQWGGNVAMQAGTFYMYGGTISGGTINNNANSAHSNMTLRPNAHLIASGGSIAGRVYSYSGSIITLSGDAQINDTTDSKQMTVASGTVLNVGTLTTNASIKMDLAATTEMTILTGATVTKADVDAHITTNGYTSAVADGKVTFTK